MTPAELANTLQVLGVTGLLALAVLAFYKGWIVTGPAYKAMEKERDQWKDIALKAMGNTRDIAAVAKKHTTLTPEEADKAMQVIRDAGYRLGPDT